MSRGVLRREEFGLGVVAAVWCGVVCELRKKEEEIVLVFSLDCCIVVNGNY